MSGRIPQSFIDELLARTNIIDLIDQYVPLRKAGKNHQALCPFHDEKSPSFTVSEDKQFYHCFGCGANGTAISFLMEYSRLGFVEAVEELASRAGIEVPREAGYENKNKNSTELYELLELVIKYYRAQLRDNPQNKSAIEYLKNRGISGELAANFELGYAPPGWDNLINELGKSESGQKRLASTGMIIARDNGGYYDRFRDRIMFPIRDHRGRAIGFGGRIIEDGTPKYLNSPETTIFHKGRELYGLYQARTKLKNIDKLYLVEGYMDVLALAQHDIHNSAASLGTAITADHLDRIFRSTSRVIFCFDGDEAGKKAAWRAMETTLSVLRDGLEAFFMFMPAGEDPDSYVRNNGKNDFEDAGHQVALSDYLVKTLSAKHDISTNEGKASFIDHIIPYINLLSDSMFKQLLVQEISRLADIPQGKITDLLTAAPDSRQVKTRRAINRTVRGKDNLISKLVSRLLYKPELASLVEDPSLLRSSSIAGVEFLTELLEFIQSRPGINCASILENYRSTKYRERLNELASEEVFSEMGDLEMEFVDGISKIIAAKDKQDLLEITRAKRPGDLSNEEKARLRDVVSTLRSRSEK